MPKYTIEEIEISDEENSDERNSDEQNYVEESFDEGNQKIFLIKFVSIYKSGK